MNRSKRPPFRFSLKTLLWVVTGCAVLLGLGVAAPGLLAIIYSAVLVGLTAVLTMGVAYGRGDLRAFSIGGLFPAGMRMLGRGELPGQLTGFSGGGFRSVAILADFIWLAMTVFAVGLLCIWVRRVILRWYESD